MVVVAARGAAMAVASVAVGTKVEATMAAVVLAEVMGVVAVVGLRCVWRLGGRWR